MHDSGSLSVESYVSPASFILSYAQLLKLRIVALLVFVALAAAFVAGGGVLEVKSGVLLIVTGGMAAGGAGMLNHYLKRKLDAEMIRTRHRPLVLGGVARARASLLKAVLTALLVLLWTPPHFWSLATMHLDDYATARIPMLPVVAGPRSAGRWGLAHIVLLLAASIVLAWVSHFGPVFLGFALVAGAVLVVTGTWFSLHPSRSAARLQFRASILYILAIFAAMILDTSIQLQVIRL